MTFWTSSDFLAPEDLRLVKDSTMEIPMANRKNGMIQSANVIGSPHFAL